MSGHAMTVMVKGDRVALRCECGWGESAPAKVGRELAAVAAMVEKHGQRDSLLAQLARMIGPKETARLRV